jgi:type VI secretion system protein ImpL
MKDQKDWLLPIGSFVLLLASTWSGVPAVVQGLLGRGLTGMRLGVVRGLLVVIALAVATWIFLRLRAQRRAKPPADNEVDLAIAAARQRLLTSPASGRRAIGKLPLILFVGPTGSTKTTAVTRSGMEAELLAGETQRGDIAVPTAAVNLWYAQGTILVEAGGRLIDDESRWARLVRHLQPSRFSAVLSGGAQAPRVAVVCFGCDELLKPGASEGVPAAARTLRARLGVLSHQLGIRLPVYVLFTKADRLPYFSDFVRSFSREEVQDVLGATLAVQPPPPPGTYADQEAARIAGAFAGILHSLSLRRLDVLPREQQEEVRAAAYEFPREFRKVSDLATQFLVELCKPSQLGVSPFLRGFYFTGVRAVIVNDPASVAAPVLPSAPQIAAGATSVFNPRLVLSAAAQSAPGPAGPRKVPEWVFLGRVFRDVVLQDGVAMGMTGGGTRVNLLRRTLLGAAAALLLLLAGGWTLAYRNNARLQHDLLAASRGVQSVASSQEGIPSTEALQRLDSLRVQTARLARYERERRPALFGLGLYQGVPLFEEARSLYFDRFERLIWEIARADLIGFLQRLPGDSATAPGENATNPEDYGRGYDALKAYLITTTEPARSTPGFLTPALVSRWSVAPSLDSTQSALARRGFDFYASELRHRNPYDHRVSEVLVRQTRDFLKSFAGVDRFYPTMIAEAERAAQPVRFQQGGTFVSNDFVVSGAFTRAGRAAVERSLSNVEALLDREEWVMGEQAIDPAAREALIRDLRSRYVQDYITQWQSYLGSAVVPAGSSVDDAARRLQALSLPRSPLLLMFALASQHTAVDSTSIGVAFRPLHALVPGDSAATLATEANQPYLQAVGTLASELRKVAAAPPADRRALLSGASVTLEQTRSEIAALTQRLPTTAESERVATSIHRAMVMPLDRVAGILQGLPGAGMNATGADLCRPFNQVTSRFPFNPQATTPASVDNLAELFGPDGSALADFENAFGELVTRRGNQYFARSNVNPQPSPALPNFLTRAWGISRSLFDQNGAGPSFEFTLRPQLTDEITQVTVVLDDQSYSVERNQMRTLSLRWDGDNARMRVAARVGGSDRVLEETGPWAAFRLFAGATGWQQTPGGYTVQLPLPGGPPLTATVAFSGDPLLRPGGMRLNCPSAVVR